MFSLRYNISTVKAEYYPGINNDSQQHQSQETTNKLKYLDKKMSCNQTRFHSTTTLSALKSELVLRST